METARRVGAHFVACVFNNAASGYVKALQHAVYGEGRYQSSDLVEMNYAAIARSMGCAGIRVTDPDEISEALRAGLENIGSPTVVDIVHGRSGADVAGNR